MKLVEIFKSRTRHPLRPRASDVINQLFTDFRDYQAKGDALIMGEGHLDGKRVYVVAQQKPKPEQLRSGKGLGATELGHAGRR